MEERGGVNKGRHPDSHPVRLARFFTVHPGKKCRRRRFRLRRWWEGSEGCVSAWFSSGPDQICRGAESIVCESGANVHQSFVLLSPNYLRG